MSSLYVSLGLLTSGHVPGTCPAVHISDWGTRTSGTCPHPLLALPRAIPGQPAAAVEAGVLAEGRELDPHRPGGQRLGPAPELEAHGLEKEIGGLEQPAAENDDLRIEDADDVGDAHAEIGHDAGDDLPGQGIVPAGRRGDG